MNGPLAIHNQEVVYKLPIFLQGLRPYACGGRNHIGFLDLGHEFLQTSDKGSFAEGPDNLLKTILPMLAR